MKLTDFITLGRSGLRVSPLCLGTMTFGVESGMGMEDAEAEAVFDLYLDRGGNFVDTANNYSNGSSERVVGELIASRAIRDNIVLATKFTRSVAAGDPNAVGNGRKAMILSLEQSLRRLKTDYIDLYWMHSWDTLTPAEEVLEGFQILLQSGKIRYFGLSDVPAWYAARLQTLAENSRFGRAIALQLEYSLVERSIEREHIPAMQELGMALCAWGPTAGGFLAGKYERQGEEVVGKGRLTNPGARKDRFSEKNWQILEGLLSVARAIGKSPAQVALKWVANRPGSTSPIIGARSRQQLEQNLEILDFDIPEQLGEQLESLSQPDLVHPYSLYHPPIANLIGGGVATRAWVPQPYANI
jgi:aryl-alcohol dehydrogenase-like predicted oxidoreductase